jgi:hypothetical protein
MAAPHPSFCQAECQEVAAPNQPHLDLSSACLLKLLGGAHHVDKVEPLIACISTEYHNSLQWPRQSTAIFAAPS